jgi:hypothetical protein
MRYTYGMGWIDAAEEGMAGWGIEVKQKMLRSRIVISGSEHDREDP